MKHNQNLDWHDAPMCAGLWVELWPDRGDATFTHRIVQRGEKIYRIVGAGALEPIRHRDGARWFGPIPKATTNERSP